jgi:predicted nucleic-acid-binding protein
MQPDRCAVDRCTFAPGYINHIILCEIVWVLQRCYDVKKQQVREIIEGLLTTKQFIVENVEVAWKAVRAFDANNADFCDALIGQANTHSGCEHTIPSIKRQQACRGLSRVQGKGGEPTNVPGVASTATAYPCARQGHNE